jgi:hypothetical protein
MGRLWRLHKWKKLKLKSQLDFPDVYFRRSCTCLFLNQYTQAFPDSRFFFMYMDYNIWMYMWWTIETVVLTFWLIFHGLWVARTCLIFVQQKTTPMMEGFWRGQHAECAWHHGYAAIMPDSCHNFFPWMSLGMWFFRLVIHCNSSKSIVGYIHPTIMLYRTVSLLF